MTIIFSTFDRIARFFRKTRRRRRDETAITTHSHDEKLPKLGDDTRVRTLLVHFPHFREQIERRFGVSIDGRDESSTLEAFGKRHGLPSPSVFYMALRLDERFEKACGIPPEEVRRWRDDRPATIVLDCREPWELEIPGLTGARALDENLLAELETNASKQAPLLLYCHHGLRSADVAAHLADRGFENVRWIVGGLDRYAATVDRSIARYEAPPC